MLELPFSGRKVNAGPPDAHQMQTGDAGDALEIASRGESPRHAGKKQFMTKIAAVAQDVAAPVCAANCSNPTPGCSNYLSLLEPSGTILFWCDGLKHKQKGEG